MFLHNAYTYTHAGVDIGLRGATMVHKWGVSIWKALTIGQAQTEPQEGKGENNYFHSHSLFTSAGYIYLNTIYSV